MCGNTSEVFDGLQWQKQGDLLRYLQHLFFSHLLYYGAQWWLWFGDLAAEIHYGIMIIFQVLLLQYTVRGEFYGEGHGLVIIAIEE